MSPLHLLCAESDSCFTASDVIKCGEAPFMGLQVREKSTGHDSPPPNEETIFVFIISNIISFICNKKLSSRQLCCFSHRKEIREQLKGQMAEKCAELKMHLTNKVKEADNMREVDRCDLSRDRDRWIQHRKAMTVFRDENKRV